MYFKLPPEKLEKVLNYLANKPWIEVQQLVAELSNLEKSNEKAENKDKPLLNNKKT